MRRRIVHVASKALKPIARLAWLSTLTLLLGSLVDADAESANRPSRDSLQTAYVWQLPAGEELGLTGLRYQSRFDSRHAVGLETSMAMTGNRGGFITLGLDGVGAGGKGRGRHTLSGGGLRLRSDVALSTRMNDVGEITGSVSSVVCQLYSLPVKK